MEEIFHQVSSYKVTSDFEGVRLDNCLISRLKGLPRTKIYSIIRKGEVRVNKSRAKPSQKLKIGDLIRIPPYKQSIKMPYMASKKYKDKIFESIMKEEKEFLILNKPEGIACHGGSGISSGVIEVIRKLDKKYKDAHLVHRIDRETSGCLVIALKKSFLRKLHQEIRNKEVDKIYDLIVFGEWPKNLNSVEAPLSKEKRSSGETEAFVKSDGKPSITQFNVIKSTQKFSHLKAKILTGRMHQIRAHTKFQGYPIVGDKKYGDEKLNKNERKSGLNRMLLHAFSINFKNLGIECTADTPKLFFEIMS
tara:strand:+ start:99 stop:1016 length:918 start_codon:yes stop_codon:yes gene_type:complete